ncbi:MAG: small multi-drug export protein [Bacteroidetes bacterium]|nr:small multi-drug export protein [Bacteroidota bacterium]
MLPQIKTILLATLPINELRGTIPLAISILGLKPIEAFIYSIIGNILPIFFILWLLPAISNFLSRRFNIFNRFFFWLFARTRQNFYKKHEKYGSLALILFVAVPLPITGAWTGAVAAFLFGIPYKKSIILIFLGVVLAGIIVTLISSGVFSLIGII